MSSVSDDIAALMAAAGSLDLGSVPDLSTELPLPPVLARFADDAIKTLLVHLFGDRDHPETPFEAPPETYKSRPTLLDFGDRQVDSVLAITAQVYYDLYRRIIRVSWLTTAPQYDDFPRLHLAIGGMLVQAAIAGSGISPYLPIICAGIDTLYKLLAVAPDETTRGLPWTKCLAAEPPQNWPVKPLPYAYSLTSPAPDSDAAQQNDTIRMRGFSLMNKNKAAFPKPFRTTPRELGLDADVYHWDPKAHVQSFFPPPASYLTSTSPVQKLRSVNLSDLVCPKRHDGTVLTIRILTSAQVSVGMAFVVEDPEGQSMPLTIEHPLCGPARLKTPSVIAAMYPVGAKFHVREPLVHFSPICGAPEISVPSNADLIYVGADEIEWKHPSPAPPLPDAAALKERGDDAAKLAVMHYSRALALPHDPSLGAVLRLNRAQISLHLGLPGAAYRDCLVVDSSILKHDQEKKLAYRKLKSAFDLQLYERAERHLQECVDLGVDTGEVGEALARRPQEVLGDYDRKRIKECLAKSSPLLLSEYTGPVEVRDVEGKGRGLFVTRKVKAGGELLFVERALSSGYPHESGPFESWPLFPDLSTRDGDYGGLTCLRRLLHRVTDDPAVATSLESLQPEPTRGFTRLSEQEHFHALFTPRAADPSVLWSRLTVNSFKAEGNVYNEQDEQKDSLGRTKGPTHLVVLGSAMNHSCISTVGYGWWGNYFAVWAANDLEANTELCFSYTDPDETVQRRNSHLEKKWGFTCHCELCEADRTDDLELRQSMMEEQFNRLPMMCSVAAGRIGAHVEQTGRAGYEKVREFAEWLDETFHAPGRRVKLELAKVKLMLGETALSFDAGLAIKAWTEALEHFGGALATTVERQGRALKTAPSSNLKEVMMTMIKLSQAYDRIGASRRAAE